MGIIEVRYSLILNFIILIWGGGKPPSQTPFHEKIQKIKIIQHFKV